MSPLPRSLSGRIALAFATLSLVTWLVVGGTLFVVLRGLHANSTTARLTDLTVPLIARLRQDLVAGMGVPASLADLRDQVSGRSVGVYLQLADGRVVGLAGDTVDLSGLAVDPSVARGGVDHGTFRVPDGGGYAWVASILRDAGPGPRAVITATPDRAGADALRDLLNTLPALIVVTLVVGVPVAWLLARSVTRPLRRVAAASEGVPTSSGGGFEPLPLDGPSEVRELTMRFDAMRAELAELRRRERELLANLRHDLRTPLTVIAGFAEALRDGTARGQAASRAATAITEEAARIDALVGELDAVERLRSGSAGLRPESLDARRLVEDTAVRFRPAASAAGVDLEAIVGADEIPFTADRTAVERILGNLVRNAIAAHAASGPGPAPGPRHVWLDARRLSGERAAPERIALTVTDDGPGFAPGGTERAFDRFYRGDPARTGAGSGLGLAIVRELAIAHGGTVHAENVAPRGARLSVVLPLRPPLAAAAPTGAEPPAAARAAPPPGADPRTGSDPSGHGLTGSIHADGVGTPESADRA